MQRTRGQMRLQLFPNLYRDVFYGRQYPLHKGHIQVEVPVVHFINNVLLDDLAQVFKIHDETRFGTRLPLDSHVQGKIMPMPVFIGTPAENLLVLLIAPVLPR